MLRSTASKSRISQKDWGNMQINHSKAIFLRAVVMPGWQLLEINSMILSVGCVLCVLDQTAGKQEEWACVHEYPAGGGNEKARSMNASLGSRRPFGCGAYKQRTALSYVPSGIPSSLIPVTKVTVKGTLRLNFRNQKVKAFNGGYAIWKRWHLFLMQNLKGCSTTDGRMIHIWSYTTSLSASWSQGPKRLWQAWQRKPFIRTVIYSRNSSMCGSIKGNSNLLGHIYDKFMTAIPHVLVLCFHMCSNTGAVWILLMWNSPNIIHLLSALSS